MKIKKIFFKKQKEEVLIAFEKWEVRWTRRYKMHSCDTYGETELCIEVFINKPDAEIFKKKLEDAFKLIRNTINTEVTIEKK